jgi:hypothetical protein
MIEMNSRRVDTIAESLGSLAAIAQKRLDDGRNRLSATIAVDGEGQPQHVSWECKLPSGDGTERQHSLLKIPWESFYVDEPMSITEVSLEFECSIKKIKTNESMDHYLITAKNTGDGSSEEKKTGHVFKLTLNSENDFTPELLLNEQGLEEYIEQNKKEKGGKNSVLSRISNYINAIITNFKRFLSRL